MGISVGIQDPCTGAGRLHPCHDIQQTIDAVKALGCKVGLTIKPGTDPEALAPYLDQLDLVLVMSVEPGFGGQKFMPSALEKLRWLKEERAKRSARLDEVKALVPDHLGQLLQVGEKVPTGEDLGVDAQGAGLLDKGAFGETDHF